MTGVSSPRGGQTLPTASTPQATKAVWPFIVMAALALPAAVMVWLLLVMFGWRLFYTFGWYQIRPIAIYAIPLLVLLAMLIGGITGAAIRSSANHKVRASEAARPAAPIGYTTDGRPIYPVVGYTPDGRPVTADRAVGMHPQNFGTNSMAVAALISAFVVPLLAVIFGHIARSQIRRTGEQGAGMALAGLILGYLWLAGSLIAAVAVIILVVAAHHGTF